VGSLLSVAIADCAAADCGIGAAAPAAVAARSADLVAGFALVHTRLEDL
jgi:hypothetical protein